MLTFFRPHRLTISAPQASQTPDGLHRVEARVGGATVLVESTHPLAAGVEGFATAFLLPAMQARLPLHIESEVCPTWLDNIQRVQQMLATWWNLAPVRIEALESRRPVGASRDITPQSAGAERNWLFFTAGVDSFYSFLQLHETLDALIFVEGFDVRISDGARLAKVRQRLAVVEAEKQKPVVFVRTNLRRHAWFRSVEWPKTHGAALAAIGHLVCPNNSTAMIASTDVDGPHGTHRQLDCLWSSHRLRFRTHGAESSRLHKTEAIAQDATVRKTLRVCWQNQSTTDLNCGYCEKCLRTQLQMRLAWPRFPARQCCFPARDLVRDLERLTEAPARLLRQWWDIADRLTDAHLREAVERLLDRSPLPEMMLPEMMPQRRAA